MFWVQATDGTKEKIHEQDTDVLFEKRERVMIDGAKHSIQMLERRMASGEEIVTDVICVRMESASMGSVEDKSEPTERS